MREAVRLGATHVSVYPLTIEPHTPFDAAVLAGELEEPDDDVEAAHMQIAARVLDSEGFERYEVASYARPGFGMPPQHRVLDGVPYLGLGRSAATMTQNAQRRMRVKDGQVTDDLDPRQMVAEDLMLGMAHDRGRVRRARRPRRGVAARGDDGAGRLGAAGARRARRRPLAAHRARLALRQRAVRRPVRSGRLTSARSLCVSRRVSP